MIHENKNHDNEQGFKVSDEFAQDLKNLYKASETVPPEIDRAILNKASQKLTRSRSRIHMLRWIGPVAAAAAIIIFVSLPKLQKQKANIAQINAVASISTDFDNSGKVDILDAFKLAKLIQSEDSVDKKWDINGDGLVDESDVDEIAIVAVSLD
jgi:hypothetical protein